MDLEFLLVTSAIVAALASVTWARSRRPGAGARLAHGFARKVDLGLDPAMEPAVTARLVRRETAGAVGALVVGVATAAAVASLSAPAPGDAFRVLAVFVGYLAGHATGYGVVAWRESARPRPADGPRLARAAVPAHGDYVPRHERIGSWVTAGISAVAGVVFLVADREGGVGGVLPTGFAMAAVVGPPAAVVAYELLARQLLGRPQVAASQAELAWDDALRARTLRDMVAVPLVTGYAGAAAVIGAAGDGLTGGWPGNPAVGVVNGAFAALLLGGLVMAFVSVAIVPERHFRRRLWAPAPSAGAVALAERAVQR